MDGTAGTWVQRLIKGNKAGDPIWCHIQFVTGALLLGGAICLLSPLRLQQQCDNGRTAAPVKMKRPLLGEITAQFGLSAPRILHLLWHHLRKSPPCSHYPGAGALSRGRGKMDLEGIPGQSSIHPSSVFHAITCLAAYRVSPSSPFSFTASFSFSFSFFFGSPLQYMAVKRYKHLEA